MIQIFICAIVAVTLAVWLKKASKNKSKWGINLKRVSCPVCETKQPIIRMPANKEQALWGGTTCPNCHTVLDKWGNVMP